MVNTEEQVIVYASSTLGIIINLTWDYPKMSSLAYGRTHILSHAWRDRVGNARFSMSP